MSLFGTLVGIPGLRHREDRRALLFLGLTLALILLPFAFEPPLALYAPWIAVCALFCFNACVVNHNHAHLPVFVGRLSNAVLGIALTLARGHSSAGVIVPHNFNHHRFQGGPGDWIRPDMAGRGRARLVRYVLAATWEMGRGRSAGDAPRPSPGARRQVAIERIALGVFIACLLVIDPVKTLLFAVLPWLLGVAALVAVNLPQHEGCDPDSRFNHSRNFTGRLGNWFLFNNGYHTAHHLAPARHWSELPAAHARIRECIDPALEQPSLLRYLFRHYLRADARRGVRV